MKREPQPEAHKTVKQRKAHRAGTDHREQGYWLKWLTGFWREQKRDVENTGDSKALGSQNKLEIQETQEG